MSRAELRLARAPARLHRPLGVAVVAGAGVLGGLSLGLHLIALIAYRAVLGTPLSDQVVSVALAIVVPLFLIWLYWSVWDLMRSAWWLHVVGGPIIIALMAALLVARDTALQLIVGDLSLGNDAFVLTLLTTMAASFLIVEVATMVYLLLRPRLFGVGVPKKAWER